MNHLHNSSQSFLMGLLREEVVPGRICTVISMLLWKIGQADLAMKLMHSKTGIGYERMGGVKFRTLLQSFVTHY